MFSRQLVFSPADSSRCFFISYDAVCYNVTYDKTTGKYKGRRLAEEVSLSHSGGYVLVGVAGMEYAASVEAKGYEVVSGANTQCEKYLRDTLKSVFRKI